MIAFDKAQPELESSRLYLRPFRYPTDEERAVFRKASLPVYDSDLMSAEDTALWKKLSDDNR